MNTEGKTPKSGTKPLKPDSEGIHAIANTEKPDLQADVVFVHGLAGSSHSTWRFGKLGKPEHFFWPEEIGNELPTCAIWSIGYPAGITGLGKPGMIIAERAANIAHRLANHRLGQRPLFFVTHSMGGLIIKSLIVGSQTLPDTDRKRIASNIRGIVFCGTPHRGSEFADMAAVLGRYTGGVISAFLPSPILVILGTLIGNRALVTQAHVNEMRANAGPLDILNDEFIEWQRHHSIALLSYAENIALSGKSSFLRSFSLGLVVPRASANPSTGGHTVQVVDEDHLSLVKPPNRQHDVYAGVLRFIQAELARLNEESQHLTTYKVSPYPDSNHQIPSIDMGRIIENLLSTLAGSVDAQSTDKLPTSTSPQPSSATSFQSSHSFGSITTNGGVTVYNVNISNIYLQQGAATASTSSEMLSSVGTSTHGDARPLADNDKVIDKQSEIENVLDQLQSGLTAWNFENALIFATKAERLLELYESVLGDNTLITGSLLVARAFITRAETTNSEASTFISRAETQLARVHRMSQPNAEWTALMASIFSLKESPNDGLALLSCCTDHYAVRTRAALLLNQHRYTDAMAVFENLAPHEWWCDVAVKTLILNEKTEKAKEIIQWTASLKDQSRYFRCCVRFAEGVLARLFDGHPKGENILPQSVTDSEREKLSVAVETLSPLLNQIQITGKPLSGLDMVAMQIAWQVNHLLQRRDAVAQTFDLMAHWIPIPVEVARGVISGYIDVIPDLPERLRRDHPGDLEANILANVIESTFFGRHNEAFAKSKELILLADSDAKKGELFKLFQTLWQVLNEPDISECEAIASHLVDHNPRLRAIFEASVVLRHGDADSAIALLDTQKPDDDIYWLQMRANACLQKRQMVEAINYLLPAAKMTMNPDLLLKAGDIAFQAKQYSTSVWCYEKLVEIHPQNLQVRNNLAHIFINVLQDLEKATIQFQALRAIDSNNSTYTLNLAICLARLFRPDESMVLYDELCRMENPPMPAVLGRAQLHHSMGNPIKALLSLESFRTQLWENPTFLLTYLSTAYAAEREEAAHEALIKLNQLQQEGAVKPETFRSVPQDDAIEMFKQSFKQEREQTDYLHAEMLRGRMFWVWAEQVSNSPIYWGWRTRTQALEWIGDEPTNRSRFSIYATNSFHARKSEHGVRELLPLESPPAGTKIVVDISALITLHQLDLLDMAIEYFSEVLVPAGYLPRVLEDSRRMVLHQRSLKTTTELIAKQITNRRISALAEFENPSVSMSIVDEYTDAANHQYRLVDIVQPLHAAGIINDTELARIIRVSSKPSAVDETHPSLTHFRAVIVDLSTLETIARTGLLDAVVGYYKIYITSEANLEVNQRLNAIASMEETRQKHLDLWSRLRINPRVKFVPHTVPESMEEKDHDTKDNLPLLATFIAQDTKIPLLADDRVCQAFTLNEMANIPCAAFGTDVLVLRLIADGKLDASSGAKVFQQLMAWRYRFLIPPPETLKTQADLHKRKPPGQALRETAEYVHGCMRDPGLFGGPEKTDLGESMAMRTYMAWLSTISEFLILVWADESFPPDAATKLTVWTCMELLPSVPVVLNGQAKVILSNTTARLFLSKVLLNTVDQFGEPRMADAMKAVKDGLRLTTEEYHQIVISVLNETAKRSP